MTNIHEDVARRYGCRCAAGADVASAADVEVIHWWTSKGESAAVSEFAKALDKTGRATNGWIAPSRLAKRRAQPSCSACSAAIRRTRRSSIPAAQYEELISGGKLLDLTDVATAGKWEEVIRPKAIASACLVDGHWWCVPVNIHSNYWAWYSKPAFEKAGLPEPKSLAEFVAAAPKLKEAGIIPFAIGGDGNGWQIQLLFQDMVTRGARHRQSRQDVHRQERRDRRRPGDEEGVRGTQGLKKFTDDGYANRNWNDTTNLVITNKAALQVMGDWARGEFAAAGMTGVKDFGCIIGLE